MPRDVSSRTLNKYGSSMTWQTAPLMQRPKRSEVASGKVLIIEAGDKTLHPIEKKYIRPELHSLMKVHRPLVRAEGLDRVVLWVDQPLEEIKGTYAYDYIRWGSKQTFPSKKSKPVPVPQRSSCLPRELWYDVTGLKPGVAFWPMAQQYRHIVAANPEKLVCNHNLFDLHPFDDSHEKALVAILNSTLVALIKTFYGRYAGTEGNLKTEVIDVLTLEVPNPVYASPQITERLSRALESLQETESGQFLEERLRNSRTAADVRLAAKEPLGMPKELQRQDRRELDDAVFELLGVADPKRRSELIDRLHRELTLHNRNIRIIEVQKMEQRRKGGRDKVSHLQLVVDAWENLEPEWRKPLPVWLKENASGAKTVDLPEGEVRLAAAENFLEADTLFFGKKPGLAFQCASRTEAELLYQIAHEGLRGPVSIPSGEAQARKLLSELEHRVVEGRRKLIHLAEERAGTDKLREQVVETLYRWFIHGVPEAGSAQSAGT
jgi:hypothetical protein